MERLARGAGLVTGGSYGPLLASHGLALDSLIAAEPVLADSQQVTVIRKLIQICCGLFMAAAAISAR